MDLACKVSVDPNRIGTKMPVKPSSANKIKSGLPPACHQLFAQAEEVLLRPNAVEVNVAGHLAGPQHLVEVPEAVGADLETLAHEAPSSRIAIFGSILLVI
jgi:hypothetical protein